MHQNSEFAKELRHRNKNVPRQSPTYRLQILQLEGMDLIEKHGSAKSTTATKRTVGTKDPNLIGAHNIKLSKSKDKELIQI